ncbi:hypothetical protein NEHOM01_1032 [Nematocida homosporus]|uniref:uncharacterized protein n=1 Tax=Nematocida homosporus TaxID=1912981 RepID=UPI002220DB76|nr:uncharacterized protein NEHOM01_1032 [Nematocida homosporus]KAI5185740.1 hypothetical protein NEHOM01_1032 [Nematocida homosporus]
MGSEAESNGGLETETSGDGSGMCYVAEDEVLVEWLAWALRNQSKMQRAREIVVKRHFGELNIVARLEEQEKLILINEYINKDFVYPPVFLGSILGFNKNNWNKNIEKLLEEFDIKQKPVYGVKENCFLFEKLKYLVLKYMERSRK